MLDMFALFPMKEDINQYLKNHFFIVLMVLLAFGNASSMSFCFFIDLSNLYS